MSNKTITMKIYNPKKIETIDNDKKNETIEEEVKENGKTISLDEKKSLSYDLNDVEIKKVNLDKNICVRIINNLNGTFIDLRKYYKGYPTKKGIRISLFMFKKLIEFFNEELK